VGLFRPDLVRSVRRFGYPAGAIVLATGAHRHAARVPGLDVPDAVLRELRGIGLPPASRGARAASTIEILMGLALIGAYLASFRERQRSAPLEDAGEVLVPPAREADEG
jgi:hypothetical protein